MDWGELEALADQLHRLTKNTATATSSETFKVMRQLYEGLDAQTLNPPPASTHPRLNWIMRLRREAQEQPPLVAPGDDEVPVTWDGIEALSAQLWAMKDSGLAGQNPVFRSACERLRQALRGMDTEPPLSSPMSRWGRDLMAQMDRMGNAGIFDLEGPWRPKPAPGKKKRVTDTLAHMLKHAVVDRRAASVIAGAEKIVIASTEALMADMKPHLGIAADVVPTLDQYAAMAIERFRPRGFIPMPHDQLVITLSLQGWAEHHIPSVTAVILVTAFSNGVGLDCQGWSRDDDDPYWAGPLNFRIRIDMNRFVCTHSDSPTAGDAINVMFHSVMTVLLACDLPHTSGQAPGERHAMTPKVAGRPVMASKFKTIELLPPVPAEPVPRGPMGDRHAPAYHAVRSHDRHLKSGKVVRVKAHHRGDAAGVVEKAYVH